jgi:hypothetical protein
MLTPSPLPAPCSLNALDAWLHPRAHDWHTRIAHWAARIPRTPILATAPPGAMIIGYGAESVEARAALCLPLNPSLQRDATRPRCHNPFAPFDMRLPPRSALTSGEATGTRPHFITGDRFPIDGSTCIEVPTSRLPICTCSHSPALRPTTRSGHHVTLPRHHRPRLRRRMPRAPAPGVRARPRRSRSPRTVEAASARPPRSKPPVTAREQYSRSLHVSSG